MDLDNMPFQDMKNQLKVDELTELTQKDLARPSKWEDITEIKPQSEKLKELYNYQREYFVNKQKRK